MGSRIMLSLGNNNPTDKSQIHNECLSSFTFYRQWVIVFNLLDLYRIVVHKSGLGKIRFVLYIQIQPIFKRFGLFSRILTNLSTQTYFEQVRIYKNPVLRICKSIQHSKDLNHGFVSQSFFQKICIVDSICKAKNLKILVSY